MSWTTRRAHLRNVPIVLEGERLRLAVVDGLVVADLVDQHDDMRIVHRGQFASQSEHRQY